MDTDVAILTATRKVPKTYSRQKRSLYDEEPPIKRRRVERAVDAAKADSSKLHPTGTHEDDSENPPVSSEPLTSSPKTSPAVWSDEAPRSSPPSSPVPTSSPPPLQRRRPVFSLFRKQAKKPSTSKQPLSERSDNDARSPPAAPPVKTKPKHMVQMQLDLASESRKACKTCGMEYIPSNAEDAALHRKFHAMNVGGVDFTKATVDRLRKNQVWSGGDGSFIAAIGRKNALALRSKTSDVLKVVNTELGAVPISDEELWSQTRASGNVGKDGSRPTPVDRFKTYLYIRGQKCIGACLAERIWEGYTVLAQDDASAQTRKLAVETKGSSISISTASTPALLGISRIWTSNLHRKQGIASRLLDCARSDFLYGLTVEKEQVAFSQPTESGGNLARKWFGREDGWRVYID
jgi:N-acetyltransferase